MQKPQGRQCRLPISLNHRGNPARRMSCGKGPNLSQKRFTVQATEVWRCEINHKRACGKGLRLGQLGARHREGTKRLSKALHPLKRFAAQKGAAQR